VPVLLLLAGAVILVGVVSVAMGRGGEMAAFPSDYLPPTLDDLLTAADVAALRPPSGLWGYNIQVTDEALGRIAQVVTERDVEIAVLRQQLAELRAGNAPAQRARGRYPVIPSRVAAGERDAVPAASQDPPVTAVGPAEPEVGPAESEAVPAEGEVGPAEASPVPAEAEAVPAEDVVPAEAEAEVVPAEAEAEVVPAEAEAVPAEPEASPVRAEPEPGLAEAAVAEPAAAPAEAAPAEAAPAEAEAGGEPAAVHGAARRDE
jgi:hypothetical protein